MSLVPFVPGIVVFRRLCTKHISRKLLHPCSILQTSLSNISTLCLAEMLHSGDLSSSMESLGYDSSVTSPGVQGSQQRTKRMRTSFKHHQLRTMKSYFNINQNPDAKDLKQLAQKTGLSKRVLQVRLLYKSCEILLVAGWYILIIWTIRAHGEYSIACLVLVVFWLVHIRSDILKIGYIKSDTVI